MHTHPSLFASSLVATVEYSGHTEVQTSRFINPQPVPGFVSLIFKFHSETLGFKMSLISCIPSLIVGFPHLCSKWFVGVFDETLVAITSSKKISKIFSSDHSSISRILKVNTTIVFKPLMWLISIFLLKLHSALFESNRFRRDSPPQFSFSAKHSEL